ncbi:leucine-rich repeats and immunoglobulin-like domains protein 3 [Leptotrombidium deliense]|uniref:Leucine-rich repeats and immunoglobulin-like domains protein 3 n=1 Tax=Leptotrombidium deliense TaxID=299467 RepID=A0A443SK50_9ACAR|nr:leucine-rich repeats and immunoglobulin-like domains protein 3 [Leptotrombidium deliense]
MEVTVTASDENLFHLRKSPRGQEASKNATDAVCAINDFHCGKRDLKQDCGHMCATPSEVRSRLGPRLHRFGYGIYLIFLLLPLSAAFRNGESNELSSGYTQCSKSCSCLGSFVDCSKRRLSRIPVDIPNWAEKLDLSHNSIADIVDGSLTGLPLLKTIDLSYNKLKQINGNWFTNNSHSSVPELQELRLNNNLLLHFPIVHNLPNLNVLIVHHNNISTLLNSSLDVYRNLKYLDLSSNRVTNIPPDFFNSSTLLTLHLTNNKLSVIEKGAFDSLPELEKLKLGKNRLSSFPKDLFRKLSKLKDLDLTRNKLRQIEGLTFLGLDKLQNLKIKRNQLTYLLDGAFYELGSLQNLHLDHNNLTHIRKGWLYGLSNLKQLQLSYNNISVIDGDGWDFCKRLWQLDVSHNHLHSVKKDTLSRLNVLQYLYLNHNEISFIEDGSFASMSSLALLELSHNQISWLLEDTNGPFIGLEKLDHLGLSYNHIKSIAKLAFSGISRLRTLDLSHNPITSIDNEAFAFKNLIELRLDSSQLICDCNIKSFALWFKNETLIGSKHQVSEAKCKHPKYLANKALVDVNPEDFTCDDFPKPYVIEDPKTQIALKGSNTSLVCKAASSSSQMTFEWRKDNIVVDEKESKNSIETFAHTTSNETVTEYTSYLHLIDTRNEDEGKYQCVISNQFGTAYSLKATITVNIMPIFTKVPVDITVKIGNTAKLECAAKGYPVPEIAWKKDGGDDFPAARERRMHVMPSDDVFFIVEAKAADTGVYSCTAKNEAGTVVVNASLTVLEIPAVVKKMKDKEARVGETAVLECKAVGSPKPVVMWKKDDDEMIATDRHFLTMDNQLLIIAEVQLSDSGKYSCEMNNVVGSARDSAYLKVEENELKVVSYNHSSSDSVVGWIVSNLQVVAITVIVVVICIVITSLCWVIIIFKTRKRGDDYE